MSIFKYQVIALTLDGPATYQYSSEEVAEKEFDEIVADPDVRLAALYGPDGFKQGYAEHARGLT